MNEPIRHIAIIPLSIHISVKDRYTSVYKCIYVVDQTRDNNNSVARIKMMKSHQKSYHFNCVHDYVMVMN